jgi:UDP-N-acetylmuramate dehydrogenase
MARHGAGDVSGVDRVTARDPAFIAALRNRVTGQVREAEPVARYSTYRIGGPATVLLPKTGEDVAGALRLAEDAGVPWFALGLGSNILLPDEGLDALVIRMGKGLDRFQRDQDVWTIGAGLPAPLAARRTAEAGFAGLHIFVGVPGTVGGGVYMNAGCHGGDWSEVVERVTVVSGTGEDTVLRRSEIPFSYRRSGLDGRIVLETTVRLREEAPAQLEEAVAEMFEWRQQGTPFNQPCCGSVFKNPAGPSWKRENGPRTAGQLIEAAGLKGFTIGGAQVSPMHANYFVNTGGATAADVRQLIAHVQKVVRERFGVRLEPEVKLIGAKGEYLNDREAKQ